MSKTIQWLREQIAYYFDFRKISAKILVGTILISIALPLSVSIILINFSESRINQYVISRNENTVRQAQQGIDQFMLRQIEIANAISLNRSVVDLNRVELRTYFLKIIRAFPTFKRIDIIEPSTFSMIYSTGEDTIRSLHSKNRQRVLEKLAESEYCISDVTIRELNPQTTIYFPVYKFGQTVSILACTIDLRHIWNLIDNIRFGEYGQSILITSDRRIIAHPDKANVIENRTSPIRIENAVDFGAARYVSAGGSEIVATYTKLSQLDWYLVIEQSVDEARDLALEMRFNMLLYLTISLLIALTIGIYMSRKISRPITELTNGVKNYGQGNLQHQIYLNSNDELEDLADEFNRMSKTLYYNQKKLRRIERITAMAKFVRLVSHEIRNPLNSMNINLQIIRRELTKPEVDRKKITKLLGILSSEIERMDDLISNYTKIAQMPQLTLQHQNVNEIIEQVVLIHSAEAESHHVKLSVILPNQPIFAQIDGNQFKQVLINLILNAFQAMPTGGELKIFLIRKTDQIFLLKVQDTGKGIPQEQMNEIFEFYYTSKESGTGIGLSLSKQIIEGHNGQIYVESRVDEGTTFYIELPITQREYVI